ncbi:hypothetical protein DFQ30_007869 [Apophysomyces sp. BC1015]|nr:hypothetical protein DFQ30_007869 [Apophysomyces sp. BC1015]KAG0176172.1 hypothetical protein DFQ29_006452 [Apophysomyces sp. BC1021]
MAIEKGLITINHNRAAADTQIKRHDVIGHWVHRHEPPVIDKDILMVHQKDDMWVIDKPGGIQIHPSGRYHYNTILHILRKTLDRHTSGLVLIALNPRRANALCKEMAEGMQKEYICRVVGEFPEHVVCEAPIKPIAFRHSFHYVHPDGRLCKTLFWRQSFDGATSVVRCKPLTGRTHQIRAHLRYLGHPIANDPLYGTNTSWSTLLPPGRVMDDVLSREVEEAMQQETAYPMAGSALQCSECGDHLQKDPSPDELSIWLHASRYAGSTWSFETNTPDWAKNDFFTGTGFCV